jgi:hypothetical protein
VPLYPLSYGGAACIVPGRPRAEPAPEPGRPDAMAAAPPCGGLFPYPGPNVGSPYNPSAMSGTPLLDLILYGRPDCGLCDEARELLRALLHERASAGLPTPTLREVDIESDPVLERRFLASIPVVELGGRRLETVTSAAKLRRLLADVLDATATSA